MHKQAHSITHFWFEECTPQDWFKKNPEFDLNIKERFGEWTEKALLGQIDSWAAEPTPRLALILLLDQFTRNIYRDTPRAFSGDEMALALTLRAIDEGQLDAEESQTKRQFLLMPMMHSEELEIQEQSLPLFRQHTSEMVYDYAVRHRDIVKRFGHFPHRNALLGRPSTAEEISFLEEPGSSF